MKRKLKETAVAGSTGAGSIAAVPSGVVTNRPISFALYMQDDIQKMKKTVGNSFKKPFPISLTENFDVKSAMSKLKNIQNASQKTEQRTTSFGIQDDDGNTMVVTVADGDADAFQKRVGEYLQDKETFKMTGYRGKDISMAELLFNLKNEFNIIDLKFPKIPEDAVYNADKVTYNTPDSTEKNFSNTGEEMDEESGDDLDFGDFEDEDGANEFGDDEEFGDEGSDEELDFGSVEGDEEGDDESVQDFEEPASEPTDEKSILNTVISMLKAQAEAEKAKAEAEAERSRALQAEYAAKAASATVAQQEELVKMQADVARQKQREKEAKKLADIAKYRVSKSSGGYYGESLSDRVMNKTLRLLEADEFETEPMLRRQRLFAIQKFRVDPNDPPEMAQYKRTAYREAIREIDAKIRRSRAKVRFDQETQKREKEESQNNQQPQNNNRQMDNRNRQMNQNPQNNARPPSEGI